MFAIEFLPKVRRDLDLVRLKLLSAQKRREPDYEARRQLRKEIEQLEARERFLERLTTRLEYALEDKKAADESRVKWAEWEVERDVEARKTVLESLRTKLGAYERLGGQISDAELQSLIEGRKYDEGRTMKITWDDWTRFKDTGKVEGSERVRKLLAEMQNRKDEGQRLVESVADGEVIKIKSERRMLEDHEAEGDGKKKGGMFSRLLGW